MILVVLILSTLALAILIAAVATCWVRDPPFAAAAPDPLIDACIATICIGYGAALVLAWSSFFGAAWPA